MKPGDISARIVIGTKTSGSAPSVVPSKPRGATPTIVIDWPLTIERLVEDGRDSRRAASSSSAWLSTATKWPPTFRSSFGSSSRPSAGCRPSTGKYVPDTSMPSPLSRLRRGSARLAPNDDVRRDAGEHRLRRSRSRNIG